MILVYITNPDKKTALKVSKYLLEKRLVACINIFKIQSLYWWKGKIEDANEYVVIAKTISRNYSKIEKEIRKIHPYKIPCIMKIKVDKINKDYLNWLLNNIKS
ncbi:MAG: divalent-cation tolerance protein CutA [Candidatus Parcubacteria bacterium]|nr:MAG: divalent-cation tolerance protein CutA [Candidatus Parcubacteria bacterium]